MSSDWFKLRAAFSGRRSGASALALLLCLGALGCDEAPPEEEPTTPAPEEPGEVPDTPFVTVDDDSWDETAVRQVLHVFAFGGFASDAQIHAWADMSPEAAIVEIVTLDETNALLSPDDWTGGDGTMRGLGEFWSSNDPENPIAEALRPEYEVFHWRSPARIWTTAVGRSGANPVRQRIGLLETNYHLVANQSAGVNNLQMWTYYDDLMTALADGLPYHDVIGLAARSAAIATQYNHHENVFLDARFQGNEDYGRELHQLHFGILGLDDPEYHEVTTIRNTSKMLTDMDLEYVPESGDTPGHLSDVVDFGTALHYPGDLEILHEEVPGATAAEKIDVVAAMAIGHPESLENLPVLLVRFLADDEVDAEEAAVIQAAWAALDGEDLLGFLRAYAISETFHSPYRVKSWTSIERNVTTASLMTFTNTAAVHEFYNPYGQMSREGVSLFRPTKNVFGGQTGPDAAASGEVFRQAYNQSVDRYWFLRRTLLEDADGEIVWRKDWAAVAPAEDDGTYRVRGVAEWLWQRFIADGLDNFGPLERAHVYALLGAGKDFGLFVNENNPMAVYTADDIETRADLQELFADMEIALLTLDSDDAADRDQANSRVGLAINFIVATPYAFAQEGR